MSSSIRLAPTEKFVGVAGDDEGVEVVAGAAGLESLRDEANDVGAERVHLGVKLDAGHAIAEIDQRGAGVFLDHAIGFFGDFNRPDAGWDLNRFPVPGSQIPVFASGRRFGIVGVPGFLACREQFLDVGRDRLAFFFHARDRCCDAGRVPEFERSHFPVEAEAHGAVDLDNGVGNLGDAIGRVGPEIAREPTREKRRLCRPSAERCRPSPSNMRKRGAGVLDVLGHFERGNLGFRRGWYSSVFQSRARRSSSLPLRALHFLVEATFGFVAQPLAVEHLAEEIGQLQIAALVVDVLRHVTDDVPKDVEADQVDGAESCGLGPADGLPVRASTSSMVRSISCMRRMTLSTENVPMRLAMKLGVSLANTTPLPRRISEKRATASIAARSASGVGMSSSSRM